MKEISYFYSCCERSKFLFVLRIASGSVTCLALPSIAFNVACTWCEVPVGTIYFTGGYNTAQAVAIESTRDFAVVDKPSMNLMRHSHGAAYLAGCLYIIGGFRFDCIKPCERYIISLNRWELIDSLPESCYCMSVIAIAETKSIYALGGKKISSLNSIQRLRCSTLNWEILALKLPFQQESIAVFKLDESQVYFVQHKALYKFCISSNTIEHVKGLSDTMVSLYGPSYYNGGRLYCSNRNSAPNIYEIGELG
mmetsp:Transcript_10234/g.19994  ORF Transcript_10234/g.19994 Transcript_10234/m.19994 type:complete len:252 (+) Transcript_10234:39-794(+)